MEAVRKVHTHLNLGGNEIRDARVEHLSEDPAPSSGRIVFNPETGEFRFSDGKKWFPLNCPWDVDQDGNIVAEGNVIIRGNLVIEQDIASFADGDDTPSIGGGLDKEMLENYLTDIGNIDAKNITEQRVLSATKLVDNSNIDIVTIDESNFIVLNRAMRSSKDAYLLGHIYTGSVSNLMLGKDNTGIYLHRTGISWHNENNDWSSSLISFEKMAIKVYSVVRPNSNNLCTLGLSDYRWSTIYGTHGDFSGNLKIKGSSSAGMTDGAGALNIGSGAVLMLDSKDIQAKATGTTPAPLYINSWGGALYLGHADYLTESKGIFKAPKIQTSDIESTNGNFKACLSVQATTRGSYIFSKDIDNAAIKLTRQLLSNAYESILGVKTVSGHTFTLGGIEDRVGFHGFHADRTENGLDWYHYIECHDGRLVHSGDAVFKKSLTVDENLFTSFITSNKGLDIVANGGASAAKLWLAIGTFRPWREDAGLIDLGAPQIPWRNVYAINVVASGDVATM